MSSRNVDYPPRKLERYCAPLWQHSPSSRAIQNAGGRQMMIHHLKKLGVQMRSAGQQSRKQRPFLIAYQFGVRQGSHPATSTENQGRTRGNVPFVLGGEGKRYVCEPRRNQSQLVRHRTHGFHAKASVLKWFP